MMSLTALPKRQPRSQPRKRRRRRKPQNLDLELRLPKKKTSVTTAEEEENQTTTLEDQTNQSAQNAGQHGQNAGSQDSPKPVKAAELRAAYDATKKKVSDLEKQLTELKAKPTDDPEKPVLIERLKERDDRIKSLEEKLAIASYEETDEYRKQFHQPFVDAYTEGRQRAARMTVNGVDGNTRQGTEADFDAIVRISDDGEAADKAEEMYGNRASIILLARDRVLGANNARQKAIQDNRENALTRQKTQIEETAKQRAESEKQRAAISAEFDRLNKEAVEKYASAFKAEDGDEEGAEHARKRLRVRGQSLQIERQFQARRDGEDSLGHQEQGGGIRFPCLAPEARAGGPQGG